jgi:hypothetical protein
VNAPLSLTLSDAWRRRLVLYIYTVF